MNDLVVKDVEFNGAVLKAAQDNEGQIWAGVRWLCDGIGLSQGRTQRQLTNLNRDVVLKQGVANLQLPTNGGVQNALCLMLDFVPLWLAKISITPAMKKSEPELVSKLITYQLKAKDVLANAFLNKQTVEHTDVVVQQPKSQVFQFEVPTYEQDFEMLNDKVDKLYRALELMFNLLEQKQLVVTQPKQNAKIKKIKTKKTTKTYVVDEETAWKHSMYELMDKLLMIDRSYEDRAAIMKNIYAYMTRVYGVCWEQERIDYKKRYDCERVPSTIKIIFENEQYKSIFKSVLEDKIGYSQVMSLDDILSPLVEKYHDTSVHGVVTYRKVYERMENNKPINWEDATNKYKKLNHIKAKPKKKAVVSSNVELRRMFEDAVKELVLDEK